MHPDDNETTGEEGENVGAPTFSEVDIRFTYHAPKGNQVKRYERIRAFAYDFAYMLCQACPESRELSLALTHLEEVVMFANASIARRE